VTWNVADDPPKVSTIIGKFGLKQGANIKNQKALKQFRSDLCNYEMYNLFLKHGGQKKGETFLEEK
jgi:hypothetical protein